jgi:tryptophanyl-tRNA synthetase
MDSLERKVLLTGAQPTGEFHLGNYLGAIRSWVQLQKDFECFFFLADLHAVTRPYDPEQLRRNTLKTLAQCLACGLNAEKVCLFAQSSVLGHTELAWILGCLVSVGHLSRMTQFKSKSRDAEFVGGGLLYYPVLMAADILLYNAHLVPVGDDQRQHLELARDLAIKFNETYSKTFSVPEPYILSLGSRIYSLQTPHQKMSKSDPNLRGTVFLFEPPASIRRKFQSAVTDSGGGIYISKDKPGISNLIQILSAVLDVPISTIETEYTSYSYSTFKNLVADAVIQRLEPLQSSYRQWLSDETELLKILANGAQKASERARHTLSEVYAKSGFVGSFV